MMPIYNITYLDKYEQTHNLEVPAADPESAIVALEEGLNEQIVVKKIEIMD